MRPLVIALAFLPAVVVACADQGSGSSSSNQPVLTGDTCKLAMDATTCMEDTDCQWLGTGCACPPNDPSCSCPPGACVSKNGDGSGSGSGSSGSGGTGVGCACSNGRVCVEQVGGPAQQSGTTPDITCETPTAGTGDPCTRITGQGTCSDSPNVSGLCVCDNGER